MKITTLRGLTKNRCSDTIPFVLGELFKGNRILCNSNFFGNYTGEHTSLYLTAPVKKYQPLARLAGTVDIIRVITMSSYTHNTIKQDGKTLGVLSDNVLRIIKTSKTHFVKKYKGYGVSPSTLDGAEARGYSMLELQGYDGEKFLLSIRDFRAAAIPADLGMGQQLFLSIKWLRYYTQQNKLGNLPKQMSLFG